MPVVRGLRLARTLLVAALAVQVLHALTGAGGSGTIHFLIAEPLYDAIFIGAGLVCATRAVAVPAERTAWTLLAAGSLAWGAGEIAWALEVPGLGDVPIPSVADAFYLSYYPLAFLGFLALAREETRRAVQGLWLDGLAGGLAAGAVLAAFVLG